MEIPKRCPFCNSDVSIKTDDVGTYIQCNNRQCDMIVSFRQGDSDTARDTNIRMFNSRTFDGDRMTEILKGTLSDMDVLKSEISSRLGGMRGLDTNINRIKCSISTLIGICGGNESSDIPKRE